MTGFNSEKHNNRIDDKNTHHRHTKEFQHAHSQHVKHEREEAHQESLSDEDEYDKEAELEMMYPEGIDE